VAVSRGFETATAFRGDVVNHIACIIFLFLVGCSAGQAGTALHLSRGQAPAQNSLVGVDAGFAPDTMAVLPDAIANVDTVVLVDVKPQSTDTVSRQDTQFVDALPASNDVRADTQVLPDGLSYPHDVVVTDAVPCMQQVVANGYASDKASCATWNLKFTEPYNSNLAVPWTSQSACEFIINCFAAKPDVYTSWRAQTDCNCTCPIPFSGVDWQPLIDIITPFCPTFFTS
jgi:hypothetical protein